MEDFTQHEMSYWKLDMLGFYEHSPGGGCWQLLLVDLRVNCRDGGD